ncbi:MAG: UDP-4-amino-4,6-dideoxy-N-acetyl-beta-L-altrosamine transaminase [Lentisphaerae bacterium GWF2_52_8]|nr:MAG: UDP-4-amino-4,6-dideoxy-N-acetyl-beta-L-altrosamine transaminase [Lentisphaerae bacterium GWF2_52_8]
MIPYGRQHIDEDDIKAVVDTLRSDYITTGPQVAAFEKAIMDFTGVKHAVAVATGTAALHCMMFAIGIKPGDEVIVPAITFAASSNAVLYQGGTPVFADVQEENLLIDPVSVESLITKRTRAILAVDYAGLPCDYDALRKIADKHRLILMADACHSLGASYKGCKAGAIADLTALSFHPVKQITTGEGGMALTDNPEYDQKMRHFRGHGITSDYRQREKEGAWRYDMVDLGYNYRITDFQCALGSSQLGKLVGWVEKRREIARRYDESFKSMSDVLVPLSTLPDREHSYHLYVVKIKNGRRDELFEALRERGIGVNVHYIPVHFHPYYIQKYGDLSGLCPRVEKLYKEILSLPIFPQLSNDEQNYVINEIKKLLKGA